MKRNVAIQAKADAEAAKVMKLIAPMKEAGNSLSQIARTLDEMGIATSRGGKWTPMQVKWIGPWEPKWKDAGKSGPFTTLKALYSEIQNAPERIRSKRAELEALNKYTPSGIKEELKQVALSETVPDIRRAARSSSASSARRSTIGAQRSGRLITTPTISSVSCAGRRYGPGFAL